MSDDLVKRLRERANNCATRGNAKIMHEAADALERRWVPVSEGLPDEDGRKWLCWFSEEIDGKRLEYVGIEYYHFHEGWATDEHVTHWQSLPSPPAKREGDK